MSTTRQYHRLEFTDFVDLQTRLVLLPRIEEEGRGAVVASFTTAAQQQQQKPVKSTTSDDTTTTQQPVAEPSKEHRDDENTSTTTTTPGTSSEETAETDPTEQEEPVPDSNVEDMTGCILVGIESQEDTPPPDFKEKDFTSILASIREETSPIVLLLESPPPSSVGEESPETETIAKQHSMAEEEEEKKECDGVPPVSDSQQPPEGSATTDGQSSSSATTSAASMSNSMMTLSAWGMRMKANTEKLAADAASSAASLSSAVAVAASEAKERARTLQIQQAQKEHQQRQREPACNIYLQSSSGAYFPVGIRANTSTSKPRSSELRVTTSSLLVVRQSPTEPCPPKGYSFQWYRSSVAGGGQASLLDDASLSSGSISGSNASCASSRHGGGGDAASAGDDSANLEWLPLVGATFAAFQPSATLVGRRLRCVISIETEDSSSETDTDDDLDSVNMDPTMIVCEVSERVSADMALFNGARQALVRGAKFGALVGLGNANGRTFRLEVSLAVCKKRRNKVFGALAIYQNSGSESLLMTDNPILQVSAVSDPSHPKRFGLVLPETPETANNVLAVLCTDGKFQLEAPNRLTRESFLLALGIANYRGKPANLGATTVLYHDEPLTPKTLSDDSSASSGSLISTSLSVHSSVKISETPENSRPPTPQNLDKTSFDTAAATTTRAENTSNERVSQLEEELRFLRSKLAKKDRVVSELQRQITSSDSAHEKTRQKLASAQNELVHSKKETKELKYALAAADKKIQSNEANIEKLKKDHGLHVSSLENRIMAQSEKIAGLEKANRSAQNEKAVLSAAVEARESKLVKMGELQSSFDKLSQKVAQHDALRAELQETTKRYDDMRQDLEHVSQIERQCHQDLEHAQKTVEELTSRLEENDKSTKESKTQLMEMQKKVQGLKSERNSYKQKGESLAKEMSKLCRNGRTTKDIEKIIADFDVMKDEVEELRKQKRKALEDAHTYRTSYEQARITVEQLSSSVPSSPARKLRGLGGGSATAANNVEMRKLMERNVELQRVLDNMTEYVNAKEMQLDTMKQVNEALQAEIHGLARASFKKDEI